MHLLRTLAPVALLFALGTTPSSEAAAQGVSFAKAADQMPVGPGELYHLAKAKQAGSCGAHMYWKKGKCVDARDKK
jgi:hypothetical protein